MYFKLIHIAFHYIHVYKYLPSTFSSNQISISYWKRKTKQAIKKIYTELITCDEKTQTSSDVVGIELV